ncbi:UNVERIFIED_CONTAM: hypothetical protein K2H54_051804 [Gekko kuhli]
MPGSPYYLPHHAATTKRQKGAQERCTFVGLLRTAKGARTVKTQGQERECQHLQKKLESRRSEERELKRENRNLFEILQSLGYSEVDI